MARLGNISINISNQFIEMQALMCERDGMIAENTYRDHLGQGVAYTDADFGKLAEQMRALKIVEGVPVQPTTCKAQNGPAFEDGV